MNNNLKGIVIDPGHGGDDPGAQGNNQLEKDFNLKISKYMYERLKELGIPVTITRKTDETINPSDRANKILEAYGNDPNVIVISNHLNSGKGDGAEIIYALRNKDTLAKSILDNIKLTGENTRRIYQRRLPSDSRKDYYFIHRDTGITEPLIIEYGFIDNPNNINFLNNNYKELAEAVIKAILNYKNIPYLPPQNINLNYIVKKGDTLYSIAKKYNTSIDEIKKLNNLTSNTLSIGEKLVIIPDIKDENSINNNEIYIVKSGDTIYSIARLYNTNVETLKKLNELASNLISIGQTIKIPNQTQNTSYIVKKGDTLYSIANKYNTTVDKLKKLNNLTSDTLTIGQKLLISN